MLNRIVIAGRLTSDPEFRVLEGSGKAVANFTLAVDRDFKNKDGERETDFIPVVVWGKAAEFVANNFAKGKMQSIEGRLQIRTYTDKEGINRKVAEVVADGVHIIEWPDKE